VERSLDDIYRLVGTSLATQESVPAAFALLALFPGDPWAAVCAAATLGGDSDTIGAIAGAIGGAAHGSWPAHAVEPVLAVRADEAHHRDINHGFASELAGLDVARRKVAPYPEHADDIRLAA